MINTFKSDKLHGGGTEGVEKLGQALLETMKERDSANDYYSKEDAKRNKSNLEALGDIANTSTEDLTSDNNTGVYTTVVADFIERALRPTLVAEEVVKRIRISNKATSAIKIPVSALVTAQALPDSGQVTYHNDNYGSETVTLGWIHAAASLSVELIEQGNVDLIQDQLFELGDAISRKVDSDIIAAMVSATPTNGNNGNYTALGTSTTIAYSSLTTGIAGNMGNNAMPSHLVVSPETWGNLMNDSDVKTALGYNPAQAGTLFPMTQTFHGLKLVISQQVDDDDVFIVDSARTGYFVEASDLRLFEGRRSGYLAQEVIAAKNYGVTIVQPKSIFRLHENNS